MLKSYFNLFQVGIVELPNFMQETTEKLPLDPINVSNVTFTPFTLPQWAMLHHK